METLKVKIKGATPLLQNRDVLSDPLHPLSKEIKEITSKRKKTDLSQ